MRERRGKPGLSRALSVLYDTSGLAVHARAATRSDLMQCGTLLMASTTPALPHVIGDAGSLIHPCSEDDLSEAGLRVFGDTTLRSELRKRSLSRASAFTWDRCVDATVTGYRTALAARGKNHPPRSWASITPTRPTTPDRRSALGVASRPSSGVELRP
jgi:hypothetical protein